MAGVDTGGREVNDFARRAIILCLKKMFRDSYFSICDVDKCLKLTNAIPPRKDYEALSA